MTLWLSDILVCTYTILKVVNCNVYILHHWGYSQVDTHDYTIVKLTCHAVVCIIILCQTHTYIYVYVSITCSYHHLHTFSLISLFPTMAYLKLGLTVLSLILLWPESTNIIYYSNTISWDQCCQVLNINTCINCLRWSIVWYSIYCDCFDCVFSAIALSPGLPMPHEN